jgi:hypothetical protein
LSTSASFPTKAGRHHIAEILLKVALSTKNQSINQSNYVVLCFTVFQRLLSYLSFQSFDIEGLNYGYFFYIRINKASKHVFSLQKERMVL